MTASISAYGRRFAAALSALLAISFAPPVQAQQTAPSIIRDAEIEETLRVYTTPLMQAAGLNPDDVNILLVQDNSINAFVSGGQNIFVHTGLILAADNPNELIGVLAHETGHIAGGHIARAREAIGQSMGASLISIGLGVLAIAAGAPDAGAALIAGSQAVAMGNFVRHSRVQESAADQAALSYLEQTGQSGQGLLDFFNDNFRRYEYQMRNAPPYLITHPYASDRVESLRQGVAAAPHRAATDSEDYLVRFRFMQAKLIGFLQSQGQILARYPASDRSQYARYARSVGYYRVSDLPSARRELESLLAESPENPYFQELMGQILFENGRAEESIPYHRRSTELKPDTPLLMVNLSRALTAAHGRQGADESIPILTRAAALEGDNAYVWRELASARDMRGEAGLAQLASAEMNFAIGNHPAALSFAERARRVIPRNTPSYQRAVDIVDFSGEEVRRMQNRGRRS